MSSIAITGGATGTGVFSLLAPSTSTNRTLTLPDSTGTVLNDQSNIEAQVKTATNASGSAPVYACRAWVNFNGTGTVAIRASGNVSSITDRGAGLYTMNFSTAMPDTFYNWVQGIGHSGTAGSRIAAYRGGRDGSSFSGITTSSFAFSVHDESQLLTDVEYVNISIFR